MQIVFQVNIRHALSALFEVKFDLARKANVSYTAIFLNKKNFFFKSSAIPAVRTDHFFTKHKEFITEFGLATKASLLREF